MQGLRDRFGPGAGEVTTYRVVGSQPINVQAGYFCKGEVAVLTDDEATLLQCAGAVEQIPDAPASAGRSHTRTTAGLPSTPESEE